MFPISLSNEINDAPQSIVLAGNGAFVKFTNNLYTTHRPLKDQLKMFDLPEVTESVQISIPTIPYKIFLTFLGFARKVYKKYKGEAVILLTLNHEKPFEAENFKVRVPEQKVTGGHINYTVVTNEFDPGEFLVGSIHSHPSFGASQSATDSNDEINFDGIHITVGHIENKCDLHARFCCLGKSYTIEENNIPNYIVTLPIRETIDCPDEWMKRVSEPSNVVALKQYRDYKSLTTTFVDLILKPFESRNTKESKKLVAWEF